MDKPIRKTTERKITLRLRRRDPEDANSIGQKVAEDIELVIESQEKEVVEYQPPKLEDGWETDPSLDAKVAPEVEDRLETENKVSDAFVQTDASGGDDGEKRTRESLIRKAMESLATAIGKAGGEKIIIAVRWFVSLFS